MGPSATADLETYQSKRGLAKAVRVVTALPARAIVALGLLAVFVLSATIGPLLLPYDGALVDVGNRLRAPGSTLSDGHLAWLGTDQLGRDLLAQIVAGSRISLIIILATSVVGGGIGLVLGLIAGYFGGWLDSLISRIGDIQLAFPGILLAILLAGTLGASVMNVVITLSVTRWVVFARVVRASALSVRNREFVESARVMGASRLRILRHYILPSCLPQFIVVATVQVGMITVGEASLSFLGLGVPVTESSWGLTIANGRDYLGSAWWIATIPGLALALVVVAIGVLGDLVRDASDPTTDF